jgi:hypothetical protein
MSNYEQLAKLRLEQACEMDKDLPTLSYEIVKNVKDLDGFRSVLLTHSMPILLILDLDQESGSMFWEWLATPEFDIMMRIGLAPALDAILEIKTVRVLELYVPAVVDNGSEEDVKRLLAIPGLSPLVCGEAALCAAVQKSVKMVELVRDWIEQSQPGGTEFYFSRIIDYDRILPMKNTINLVTASMNERRRVAELEGLIDTMLTSVARIAKKQGGGTASVDLPACSSFEEVVDALVCHPDNKQAEQAAVRFNAGKRKSCSHA